MKFRSCEDGAEARVVERLVCQGTLADPGSLRRGRILPGGIRGGGKNQTGSFISDLKFTDHEPTSVHLFRPPRGQWFVTAVTKADGLFYAHGNR